MSSVKSSPPDVVRRVVVSREAVLKADRRLASKLQTRGTFLMLTPIGYIFIDQSAVSG